MPGTAEKSAWLAANRRVEAAETADQFARQIDGALALAADAQEDRQQFARPTDCRLQSWASSRSRGRSSSGQSVIAISGISSRMCRQSF
jgi:pyridoxine/pyridoxamine 5'-phosphate oxidase